VRWVEDIRDRAGEALFLGVAGPDGELHRDRVHRSPGPRWFAPGSPITVVHGDAAMFVGGLRALLLQTLHPVAMTAVAEPSDFRRDTWGRLHRTSRFLAVTTFGTASDAGQAVDAVRRIHERVRGQMPDGTPYAASDPHLLEWVHVAEVDSFLRAHTVYGERRLRPEEKDEYVAQAGDVARRLGVVDPPTSKAALAERLAAFRPELRGTPQARETASYLLLRPPLPLALRPAYGVLAAAAVGLMPVWTRLPLRLPWLPVYERTVVRVLGRSTTTTIRWVTSAH
jgi:uncharacterized protein (DUF2236 family)